jgi:hypothetical protein
MFPSIFSLSLVLKIFLSVSLNVTPEGLLHELIETLNVTIAMGDICDRNFAFAHSYPDKIPIFTRMILELIATFLSSIDSVEFDEQYQIISSNKFRILGIASPSGKGDQSLR